MIIGLEEAKKKSPEVTQLDLDSFEASIRQLTNNNFQDFNFRLLGLNILGNKVYTRVGRLDVFKVGDTVEINETKYNNGLYTIKEVGSNYLTLNVELLDENSMNAIITKVVYPPDIKKGLLKLLDYDTKMSDKLGVKQESVARWSVTYYDVNSSETTNGFPKSLYSFIDKYQKIRW